jgi:FkbM family methyltransferase
MLRGAKQRVGRLVARVQARERLVPIPVPDSDVSVYARTGTSDRASFEGVFNGEHEYALPTEARLILDLGANAGYAAVLYALRHPGAHVVAVEPEPSNVRLIRQNVKGLDVDVVPAAVWPHAGEVALEDPGKGRWGFRVREEPGGRAVPAVTVPQLLERAGAAFADLVKIDIEGAELELFSEGTEWLDRVGVVAVELHDDFRPGCRAALDGALSRANVAFHEERMGVAVVLTRVDLLNDSGRP